MWRTTAVVFALKKTKLNNGREWKEVRKRSRRMWWHFSSWCSYNTIHKVLPKVWKVRSGFWWFSYIFSSILVLAGAVILFRDHHRDNYAFPLTNTFTSIGIHKGFKRSVLNASKPYSIVSYLSLWLIFNYANKCGRTRLAYRNRANLPLS